MTAKPATITRLSITAVKRIEAAEIQPDGSLVIVGGNNAAGKSSVLDSIAYALAGKGAMPSEPLRRGADKGETVIELSDGITIRRTYTAAGGGSVRVESADGARYPSPQRWLDERISALSVDPLAFTREPSKRQAEILRDLTGCDTTTIDAERAEVYSERTEVNRDGKRAAASAERMPHHDDIGEAPDLADLRAAVEAARTAERDASADVRSADAMEHDATLAERHAAEIEADAKRAAERIEQIDAEIARLQIEREKAVKDRHHFAADLRLARDAAAKLRDKAEARCKAAVDAEAAAAEQRRAAETALDAARQAASDHAVKVADNTRRAAALAEVEQMREQSRRLTARLAEIDAAKAEALAAADMPVDGLGFGDDGQVTYQGIPLDQASQAEQIRVSMAIALAGSPEIAVALIRDGSLLDADHLALVAKLAADAGAQVWIERVGDGDASAVVIEDGRVRGADQT